MWCSATRFSGSSCSISCVRSAQRWDRGWRAVAKIAMGVALAYLFLAGSSPGQRPGELQRLQDASTAVLERLMGLEAEVKYVSTELRAEKLLWSSRYLELLREQQELREQVQEWGRSQGPEAKDTLEMQSKAEAPSADGSDGWCMGDSGWGLQTPSGTQLRRAQQHPGTRASVPRSPWDLRLGHRAKVLLQSGGVGAGTIRYLGVFPDQAEVSMGVELEDPGHGAHDNVLVGHCCFPCKAGHGAFVPFRKTLMVGE
ncbi:unnamed protein product [Lepidochelys olivacea]